MASATARRAPSTRRVAVPRRPPVSRRPAHVRRPITAARAIAAGTVSASASAASSMRSAPASRSTYPAWSRARRAGSWTSAAMDSPVTQAVATARPVSMGPMGPACSLPTHVWAKAAHAAQARIAAQGSLARTRVASRSLHSSAAVPVRNASATSIVASNPTRSAPGASAPVPPGMPSSRTS